jgi:hypothetical protein
MQVDIVDKVQAMDYSRIMENLEQASLFDLYRLGVAINQQLENPQRIDEIKKRLNPGQIIRYFDPVENRLIGAEVIQLKRTQLLVENIHDHKQWIIPVYWVNLDKENTDITVSLKKGLDKSQLKVGEIVGFLDKQNNDVHGEIVRLNQKTATIRTNVNTEWRVGYEWLYLVIDGEQRSSYLIEGQIVDEK